MFANLANAIVVVILALFIAYLVISGVDLIRQPQLRPHVGTCEMTGEPVEKP